MKAASTLTATRALSLRAPIANDDERALFQRRLALAAFMVFILAFGFWAIMTAAVQIANPQKLRETFFSVTTAIQLGTTFTAGFVWLVLRKNARSRELLGILDAVFAIGICTGWAFMVMRAMDRGERPESVAVLASSYTLVLRAALLPSTPARTALISAVSMAPILPVTYAIYGPEGFPKSPLHPAVYTGIWLMLGVSATTVISYVIYGLRLEVRKAMQLGQYMLEDKIGEGGMGTVYRASHALLRRPAALKLLTGTSGNAAERFEREVQITARLTHPNTVAVFDYGHTPDGVFYYAMEYLEGVSLEDLVGEHGAQDARRVVHVLLQACGALEEAHAAGLVHRDIKPANIMLTERGGVQDVVKVLDFGLVKESLNETATASADAKLSGVNTIMGTPHYLAPEGIVDPASVDGRADIYALGATAYYLLTGKVAFDGANLVEVCSKHLHEPPPSPRARRERTSRKTAFGQTIAVALEDRAAS
jgi:serine/threonine-protein kinase